MKKQLLVLGFVFLASLTAITTIWAQKKYKPWTEWNEKDALKMLDESPWGQTQTDTNTAEMFYNPTASGGGNNRAAIGGATGSTNNRGTEGATNQAVKMNYRIRLLSARPIRQAFARRLMLQNPQAEAQLKAFADQRSADFVVVAVDYDCSDQRFTNRAMQAFNATTIGALTNVAYLERKDGKRVFIKDFKAPINDGMGAKFVFPRKLEGEDRLFIKEDDGYLRFYAEIGKDIKLNMRFKVTEMTYDGSLEY